LIRLQERKAMFSGNTLRIRTILSANLTTYHFRIKLQFIKKKK
jgi:hypothetical protein